MKTQACTEPQCDKPSIPGLIRGHGKCQYHWNVGAFGRKWADDVRHMEEEHKSLKSLD